MDTLVQLMVGVGMGAMLFMFFIGRDYLKSCGWLLGPFDPNLGYATEEELISEANKMALLVGALLVIGAFVGPTPLRRNWEVELMGAALGMLITYLALIGLASSRIKSSQR